MPNIDKQTVFNNWFCPKMIQKELETVIDIHDMENKIF